MVVFDAEFGGGEVEGLFASDYGGGRLVSPLRDYAGQVGLWFFIAIVKPIAPQSRLVAIVVVVAVVAAVVVVVAAAEDVAPAVHRLNYIWAAG